MIRDQFRSMPPLRHDKDPGKSAILARIMELRGCDLGRAIHTFHYLRRKRHIVFSKAGRTWSGVEHVPVESEAEYRARMTRENAELRAKVAKLETLADKLRKSHNSLLDRLGL